MDTASKQEVQLSDEIKKETTDFVNTVLDKMNDRLIDEVFLLIQNDKELMGKYLEIISKDNRQERGIWAINKFIGRRIGDEYGLISKEEETNPRSNLIKTYSKLKSKN